MINMVIIVAAYLLGSISFAVLMSKAFGLPDPRSYGSHNPGATNVLRSGKKAAAALTLLGDIAKGWVAVFAALHFATRDAKGALLVALVALSVFLGHLFPIFLRFKGGKGVATSLGVLLGLNLAVGIAALLTWLFVALMSRISSLAALSAAAAAPIYVALLDLPPEWVIASCLISLLLIWRHRGNIRNLQNGKEPRIGKRDATPTAEHNTAPDDSRTV